MRDFYVCAIVQFFFFFVGGNNEEQNELECVKAIAITNTLLNSNIDD